jgi:hypothetical protein
MAAVVARRTDMAVLPACSGGSESESKHLIRNLYRSKKKWLQN